MSKLTPVTNNNTLGTQISDDYKGTSDVVIRALIRRSIKDETKLSKLDTVISNLLDNGYSLIQIDISVLDKVKEIDNVPITSLGYVIEHLLPLHYAAMMSQLTIALDVIDIIHKTSQPTETYTFCG